ncbi:MAG: hypothetical protein A2149_00880 [Candidatus Schekmanbacteria bacterium RBG_16_38_11]|uniref:Glycoside hydrolase n=1 Tax=Candidatus Schekmanbacteria bacterium RBG_16_38_11 TaxID=1817880 RepID=A0A1F7S0D2_9BACT|nr:MAG: hypothetical protein A2149_00880 [Candidatus Schekmanbacteria bacterium RBG_16_38_11]
MSKDIIGSFSFVLHSHLPYVLSHGTWPHGTDWINEAAAECYIPILNVIRELVEEGISPKMTIGITPVLTEQLSDKSFKEGFKNYLEVKIQAAEENRKEFLSTEKKLLTELAERWCRWYSKILSDFNNVYNEDIVQSFAKFQNECHVEIITCAATHGYLPLLGEDVAVQAQVKQAISAYKRHYGRHPKGIWLPECAYRPRYKWRSPLDLSETDEKNTGVVRKGVEEFLSENGIEYFIIDSHLLKGGKAIGIYLDRYEALQVLWSRFAGQYQERPEEVEKSPYEIYLVSSSGAAESKKPVAVFTRDPKTGIQVWSGEHGYPGDGRYLDFHKKHFPGGHRYWKVTSSKSDLADKLEYYPEDTEDALTQQSDHFKALIKETLRKYKNSSGKPGILVAPFDAELFGHWWFEGTEWIKRVIRHVAQDPELVLTTCGEYLENNPTTSVITLPEGSWGEGGFHWIWLNEWTKWTWKHIYEAEKEMKELAKEFSNSSDGRIRDVMQQLARELLLLESSDWQFLISTWSARDYAEIRVDRHYRDFKELVKIVRKLSRGEEVSEGEWIYFADCKQRDSLFPDVDPSWWAKLDYPPVEGT